MSKKFRKGHYQPSQDWWNTLSNIDKRAFKNKYEEISRTNHLRSIPYPDMMDTSHLRISELSKNRIHRIWVFREYIT
jgi:hypothetical protein